MEAADAIAEELACAIVCCCGHRMDLHDLLIRDFEAGPPKAQLEKVYPMPRLGRCRGLRLMGRAMVRCDCFNFCDCWTI